MPKLALIVFAALAMLTVQLSAQDAPDAAIIGGPSTYVVRAGDTIAGIAARYAVDAGEVAAANRLRRNATLLAGQILNFDNTHIAIRDPDATITINVPQRLLFLRDGDSVTAYPIAVGTHAWPTPLGAFTIVDKETDPTWDVPVSIQREMERQGKPVITQIGPSPANPLGAYWLRLSVPGIGIHGTNAPESIYRFGSHGCIRMHPDDIATVFNRVALGTRGVIVYEPIMMVVMDGRIWLEAHPDEYGLAPDRFGYVRARADHHGLSTAMDWAAVDRVLRALAGRAEDVTKRETKQ
jgi:L,D-transpeptidase ErfK/SrfK